MNKPLLHIAFCPHCGNRAPQREAFAHGYRSVWYSEDGTPDHDGPALEAILCICSTCDEPLLYVGVARDEFGEWPDLVYPEKGELHRAVPKSIRDTYAEAFSIKANAPRGYTILIRAAIEAVCDDKEIRKANLQQRLQDLAAAGHVPPTLAQMSDALRTLGNAAVHEPAPKITVPMTWSIDAFFRAIVEYVYVAPAKLDEFRKALAKASPPLAPREPSA